MTADFLLELLSEEIPARMQDRAREDLARLFADEMARAGIAASAIETFATPRRLALIARALPLATAAQSEEIKGPRVSAPAQALEGFLRKSALKKENLVERDGVWFAVIDKPGRATADVLAQAIPAIVRGFPWPKSMRWGAASAEAGSLRWVRPLQGIVALLGEDVVPVRVEGMPGATGDPAAIRAGAATVGHRFHHPGTITIGSAGDYAAKLRACHVIVDQDERRAIIRERAAALAAEAGLSVIADEGLVAENAGLTEWPVPLLGRFDRGFLEVPREVIQLTLRTNQKYFVLNDAEGSLAPAFVCTANIDAADGGAQIVAGNARVLAARLSDAKFFWEQDLKIPLEEQATKLKDIVFHEKLGTVADKVERVAKLARWLVEEGIVKGADPQMAEDAAKLAKADLVTGMVGEFPELQGIMGGHYARAQGLPDEVADAIRDHYKPVGQGDEVPTAPVTVAVSLADKLDTVASFFGAAMPPTGSKDPFALRRGALGVLQLIVANDLRLSLQETLGNAQRWLLYLGHGLAGAEGQLLDFFADRLKVQQREAGVRHDLIDAVFALGGEDDLVRLLARVKALQAFVATPDGANLLAGYKRAANILRKENYVAGATPSSSGGGVTSLSYTAEIAEADLIAALDAAEPRAEAAVEAEDFEGAMTALSTLRAPIDSFFEQVTVNDPDPARRSARLALLARVRDAVHRVADFSMIEG